MTLEELNLSSPPSAKANLLCCCGSARWAAELVASRPFHNRVSLFDLANSVWWTLSAEDWLEAFAAHPKIGDTSTSQWSREEQSGVESNDPDIQLRLRNGNFIYQNKFGWIFLVNASGKTGKELADSLETRLQNEPAIELHIAAAEQAQIMNLRLEKLLRS